MVFVDTSAWFAFFVPSDPDHHRLRHWYTANAVPLATTDFIVDETLTLLLFRRERQRALQAGDAFFNGGLCTLYYITADQVRRAWELFQQRAAAGWSFTDCTSKIAIDDMRIRAAAALDHHFQQFGDVSVVP